MMRRRIPTLLPRLRDANIQRRIVKRRQSGSIYSLRLPFLSRSVLPAGSARRHDNRDADGARHNVRRG